MIDLAGSERVAKSGVTGSAMKEAQNINRSLSALGDVMEALDNKAKHVPYRNSTLTFLLQNCLGGNARAMMLVTVCPTELTCEETLFTLQFATRVRKITLAVARKNSNVSIKNLEEQLVALRMELREVKKKRGSDRAYINYNRFIYQLQSICAALLEETILELKKDRKKEIEKRSGQWESKVRQYDEMRRQTEAHISQLLKSNADLNSRIGTVDTT